MKSVNYQFLVLLQSWNRALCELDSDGDGMTNGQELGDPDCEWTKGGPPSQTTGLTHPGNFDGGRYGP